MNLKNKIAAGLCVAFAAASFCYPFSGTMVYAEPVSAEADINISRKTIKETEQNTEEVQREEEKEEKRAEMKEEAEEAGRPETKEKEAEEASETKEKETEKEEASETRGKESEKEEAPETKGKESEKEEASETKEKETEEVSETKETETKKEETSETEKKKGNGKEEIKESEEERRENAGITEEEEIKDSEDLETSEMTKEEKEQELADETEIKLEEASSCRPEPEGYEKHQSVQPRSAVAGRSSIGISETHPVKGQENRYTYTGTAVTWTVPASGFYDLYCYGAQGGRGGYDGTENSRVLEGSQGSVRGARAFLEKGTKLVLSAGQMPGNASCHYGEGSTHGEIYGAAYNQQYVSGFEVSYEQNLYQLDNGSGKIGASCGGRKLVRGYPDGGYGGSQKTICDSKGSHSGGAAGGGGGGSSYILCGGVKILSAKGGEGGNCYYECNDGDGWANGGTGGGSTLLAETKGVKWHTEELDENISAGNTGYGYVRIRVVQVAPTLVLHASESGWTKEDIRISAEITSEGQGLAADCFSWETDENGDEIWTERAEYIVPENGTYTCKVRDTDGNIGEALIEITNIDKEKPEGEIGADQSEWTRDDIILTITAQDAQKSTGYASSGLADQPYLWGKRDESGQILWESAGESKENTDENETNEVWAAAVTYVVSENGTYLCRIRDKAGNETTCEYKVKNIDRTAPAISYERTKEWYEGSCRLTWKGEDLQPDGSAGSGLHVQAYSYDGLIWTEVCEQNIPSAGSYQIWVRDALGNTGKQEVKLQYDKKEESGENGSQKSDKSDDGNKEASLKVTEPEEEVIGEEKTEDSGLMPADWNTVRNENPVFPNPFAVRVIEGDLEEGISLLEMKLEQEEEMPKQEMRNKEMKFEKTIVMNGKDNGQKQIQRWKLKRIVLYTVWMAVIFCALFWLLFSLLFEHVTVYRRERGGAYCRIGRCAIVRKKEYLQINLIHLMKKEENRDYQVRFSKVFVWLHKKRKVLVRTSTGVELRNMMEKIEIFAEV